MYQRICRLLLIALVASLATGCGGDSRRLGNGSWYGKVVAVNVAQRTLTFVPGCRFSKSKRWNAVPATSRVPVAVTLSPRADWTIYCRPNGNGAEGHAKSADLKHLADAALHGHLPNFPPGWFVTVRDRTAVSLEEDSGIRSPGQADQQTFACVWSRSTRVFVSR